MSLYNLQINPEIKINFCFINNNKFLLFKKNLFSLYVLVPSNINIVKNEKGLLVESFFMKDNISIIKSFYLALQFQIKKLNKPVVKCLLFKGLGLKIHSLTEESLQLKLGFSHIVDITIPQNLKITRIKNFILVEGVDAALVGNFADFIKKKRIPDLYKGKGIFYKNENIKLKIIKKN